MAKVGDRVFAVRNGDDNTIYLYGHGTFLGHKPRTVLGVEVPNPCIELDDDKGIIWGCECWWGPESRFKKFCDKKTVEVVPMPTEEERSTVK